MFFLFAERELVRRLGDFSPAVSALFTSDVFAANPYAPKIHVQIEKLPNFQQKNRSFTFGSYFSTSYEVASGYYDAAFELLKQTNSHTFKKVHNNQKERVYYETLKASKCVMPDLEVIDTLGYLRLRRNVFIHISGMVSPALDELIEKKGVALNAYWGSTRQALDFTSKNVPEFGEDETVELLKILRIVMAHLDESLGASLVSSEVIWKIIQDEQRRKRVGINQQTAQKFATKIKKLAHQDYGMVCTIDEVMKVLKRIPSKTP